DPNKENQQQPVTRPKPKSEMPFILPAASNQSGNSSKDPYESLNQKMQKPSDELIKVINNLKMMMSKMASPKNEKGVPFPEPLMNARKTLEDQEIDDY